VAIVVTALIMTYSRGALFGVVTSAIVVIAVRRTRTDVRRVFAFGIVALAIFVAAPGWPARLDPPSRQALFGATIEVPDDLVLDPAGLTTRVSVTNQSTRTWRADGGDRVELSARWVGAGQDWIWGEQRWALPADLAPGASVDMTVMIEPSIPVGTFDVQWDLVGGGRARFLRALGQETSSRGVVRDSAVDPSDVEATPLLPRRRSLGRIEIWRLAVHEFAGAPVLGVGPSELAIATADEVDETRTFNGRHAHNLFLEPLATTGLLGTAPLLVVLAGGLWFAARRVRRRGGTVALAALAALIATMVHGLVDWPLVYTSAAIPIALVTGIAWTWNQPPVDSASTLAES
jgi:hypothetical protein